VAEICQSGNFWICPLIPSSWYSIRLNVHLS